MDKESVKKAAIKIWRKNTKDIRDINKKESGGGVICNSVSFLI